MSAETDRPLRRLTRGCGDVGHEPGPATVPTVLPDGLGLLDVGNGVQVAENDDYVMLVFPPGVDAGRVNWELIAHVMNSDTLIADSVLMFRRHRNPRHGCVD